MNELGLDEKIYQELLADWYDGLKNKEIISKYNLSISPQMLQSYIQPLVVSQFCPYCKTQMQINIQYRSLVGYENMPLCPSCNHREKESCICVGCIRKKKEDEEQKKKELLDSILSLNKHTEEPIPFSSLLLEQKLWVASFIYGLTDESLEILTTLRDSFTPIYPNPEKTTDMFKQLIEAGVLQIIDFDDRYITGELSNISYNDLITKVNTFPDIGELYELIHDDGIDACFTEPELNRIENELLIDEIYELIAYNMDKVGFTFRPGAKTRLLVKRLASVYDYLQLSGMIWNAANRTLRYVQESKVNRVQAFNTFIRNLDNYFLLSIKEGWTPRPTFRPHECPMTAYRYLLDKIKQHSNNNQKVCMDNI